MKPIWLIEDFDPDDSRTTLIEEVKQQGFQCEVIKYIPFESGSYDAIPNSSEQCVIFQGSLNLGRQLRREKSWIPGVWCSLENFECTAYYPHYAQYLLNDQYFFIPVKDLYRRKDELYKLLGIDDTLFIRPNSGFKTFTGRAIPREEFDSDYEWMVEFSGENALALVARPKPIEMEYRFIVADEMDLGETVKFGDPNNKAVLAGSAYRKEGGLWTAWDNNSSQDRSAWEYLDSLLSRKSITWFPDPVFTVDVCLSGGKFWILELNSFSCSGLYACDLHRIVKGVSAMAVKAALAEQ